MGIWRLWAKEKAGFIESPNRHIQRKLIQKGEPDAARK
jgi:hypothetical protein